LDTSIRSLVLCPNMDLDLGHGSGGPKECVNPQEA
jgi:hypothetical protein